MADKQQPINNAMSDGAILVELGARLARYRVDADLTQQALAEQAGVSKRTLERIEAGEPSQLPSLIRILRVLDMLALLDAAIPAPAPRPMELLRNQRKPRQRVRKRRTAEKPAVAEKWVWGDER
jgi:transcriptional regulator with XRE-family HTH domain